jgi:Bacterial transglutaminase-like cysteine proteinase BTLCP
MGESVNACHFQVACCGRSSNVGRRWIPERQRRVHRDAEHARSGGEADFVWQLHAAADGVYQVLHALRRPVQTSADPVSGRSGPSDRRALGRPEPGQKTVNGFIVPEPNTEGVLAEKWLINPASGDCNDYAVSKRFELLKRGWPARALLLSEVRTAWGEGHLVLIVRTSVGDLVLDNLTPQIRPWTRAPYHWVRMQTPNNPNFWASLGSRSSV